MGWSRLGRRSTVALAILLVLVATLVPVAISLVLASRQAHNEQERSAVHYARDVLKRSELIAQQIARAFERMAALPAIEDCRRSALRELHAIDAGSSYLQLVGVVENDAIVCSSYGVQASPWPLGEVDYVSALGLRMRTDVRFPFAPGESFIVAENGRFAAVIHKALPVDATVAEPGVSLAIVSASRGHMIASRGNMDARWIPVAPGLAAGEQRTLMDGGTAVAQMRSNNYDLLAIAALGDEHYSGVVTGFARVMVPFGLVVGGLLSWLLLRIMRAQTTLPAAIRAGLRNREFFIELQPIVRLSDRAWVGAEVLLRWRRQDGRLVRPDLFIAAAEESGLIRQVTARVLELTAPVLRGIAGREDGFFLSVNLAADDLHHEAIAGQLAALLASTGASGPQLHVEITERALLDETLSQPQLEAIRALGVAISIDDFGTGYSSLSGLVGLRVDALKIDKAFVDTIGSEAVTSHVASHIVEMAHALSLQMIAEGVESPRQADTLAQWRVQYGQGWLFSASLPVGAFLSRLPVAKRREPTGGPGRHASAL